MELSYTLREKMYMLSKEPTVNGTSFYHEGPTAIFFSTPEKGWAYLENCDVPEDFGLAILGGWDRLLEVCNYLKEQGITHIGMDPETQKFLAMPIDRYIRDLSDMVQWDKAKYATSDN